MKDKLKTLKDIREKAIKDICKNLKVKPDTLCYFGQLGTMSVEVLVTTFLRDYLKAEAIKWVKEREKRNTIITNKDWDDFFNITEEDLKDEVEK